MGKVLNLFHFQQQNTLRQTHALSMSPLIWSVFVLMYLCQANKKCIDECPNSLKSHKTMNSGNGTSRNSIKWQTNEKSAKNETRKHRSSSTWWWGSRGESVLKKVKVSGMGFYSMHLLMHFSTGVFTVIINGLAPFKGPLFESDTEKYFKFCN